MTNLYIKVGSITNAQRGRVFLQSHGYKAEIKKIENPSRSDGCGYMLVLSSDDDKPLEILKMHGISIRGVERI